MNLRIRRATDADIPSIANNVVEMAFEGSKEKLSPGIVLQGVKGLFERPTLGFYIVAELDGKNIGSMVIVYEWSDWRNGLHWWMHSIYVKQEFRGKEVFPAMIQFVKNEAKLNEAKSLRLAVNDKNERAIKAYKKLEMTEQPSKVFISDF